MPKDQMPKQNPLPGALPGEADVKVRAHERRRKKSKMSQACRSPKRTPAVVDRRPKEKQPTMRRICRAEATRATLQAVKQRLPTLSTPESTGKADFPHDLEKGALQRRGSLIATRGRKSLDRELGKVDTSLPQVEEVD